VKILSIDTATPIAALAVTDDDRPLAELSIDAGAKRGEVMALKVDEMLKGLGLEPADLEAYAVGIGPGSFTGLRSSLAFIKGLALANPGPVAGVSTLHALAMNGADYSGPVLPVIDAKKGEVFTALFRSDDSGVVERESDDAAIAPERLSEMVEGPVLLLGDGIKRYSEVIEKALPQAVIAPESMWHPRASLIAALALPRLRKGDSDPVHSLVPVYVRSSDAELKLGPRKKAGRH
jgi:tRNA threonylcarbamoyladenosine biosynthesis protein TsaB